MKNKLLVVDDEEIFANELVNVLNEDGFDTSYARNGSQALEMISLNKYDVIITDVLMPDIDGFELCIKLFKDGLNNKIIVMTGGGRIDKAFYLKAITKLGAFHTIPKPFNFGDLKHLIQKVLHSDKV